MSDPKLSRRGFFATTSVVAAAQLAPFQKAFADPADGALLPLSGPLVDALRADGEFMLMARHWSGGIRFEFEDERLEFALEDGFPVDRAPTDGDIIHLAGPRPVWEALLAARPPRYFNDVSIAIRLGMELKSDGLFFTQYYPAIARLLEVARPPHLEQRSLAPSAVTQGQHDSPVGRYVHLTLEGHDHRIYYEEAGTGIPLLLQHTAGAHGTQWRHLFERTDITDHFRLIAYDLPFHGKSVPPTGRIWWDEQYKLRGEFLRSVPVKLTAALGLDQPVFMGCSVGGLLALDLAYHHPELFRAVVSVEGALDIEGDLKDFGSQSLYHPQVSNEFKGRLMHGLTSPDSPEPYRRETIQTYMAGWPQAFIGDLEYYVNEFDLTAKAGEIDTSKIDVHIMNGEYDFSGSWELGEAAHMAIPGSSWTKMNSLGHFPMCEDPELFLTYLLPILETIRAKSALE